MKVSKVRMFGTPLLLLSTMAMTVIAYEYFWRTDPVTITSGVVLKTYPTPTMGIGVYWDAECTQPVTAFDFGEMIHPDSPVTLWKTIYIRNEGDVWHVIYWNSTLSSVTTEITEYWSYGPYRRYRSLHEARIEPRQVFTTYYEITISAYATVGTYNWTLNVWAEHWY
jgi:hypothetical protein